MKVLVGMSGGVDSSVAALLLKEAGHEVIGATMSIWGKDNLQNTGTKNACYGPDEKEDIEEARRICNEIGIPFYVFDCVADYEKIVLENFRKEYLAGRTPNPCIWCNSLIKFDVLPFMAKKAGIEFDKFATGHYAQVEHNPATCRYVLKKANEPLKDQTYFLYRLRQDQLENILFPLGNLSKDRVREIAKDRGLHVFDKQDSQDFYSGDYNELLCVKNKIGNIVDKDGKLLGQHDGIWNFTIGQRKGIRVSSSQPLYVIGLNKEKNEVIVGPKDDTFSSSLIAIDLNWIAIENIDSEIQVTAKIRSAQSDNEVTVTKQTDDEVYVTFQEPQNAVTPGQSIVFYDKDVVLGGGIINEVRQ